MRRNSIEEKIYIYASITGADWCSVCQEKQLNVRMGRGIGFKWPHDDPLSGWTPFVAFEVILINKLAEITKRYRWRKVKAKKRGSRASMPRKTQQRRCHFDGYVHSARAVIHHIMMCSVFEKNKSHQRDQRISPIKIMLMFVQSSFNRPNYLSHFAAEFIKFIKINFISRLREFGSIGLSEDA